MELKKSYDRFEHLIQDMTKAVLQDGEGLVSLMSICTDKLGCQKLVVLDEDNYNESGDDRRPLWQYANVNIAYDSKDSNGVEYVNRLVTGKAPFKVTKVRRQPGGSSFIKVKAFGMVLVGFTDKEIGPTNTVAELKQLIYKSSLGLEVEPARQRLIFEGKELENSKRLQDYQIRQGSVYILSRDPMIRKRRSVPRSSLGDVWV